MGRRIGERGKTHGLAQRQFNRTAKGEENNNNNTDKKNIQSAIFSPLNAQPAPEQKITLPQPAPPLRYQVQCFTVSKIPFVWLV